MNAAQKLLKSIQISEGGAHLELLQDELRKKYVKEYYDKNHSGLVSKSVYERASGTLLRKTSSRFSLQKSSTRSKAAEEENLFHYMHQSLNQ